MNVDPGTLIGGLAALVAGGMAVRRRLFVKRVHENRDAEAELAQKDLAINTQRQVISALEERVGHLEDDLARIQKSLDATTFALNQLRARYETLEAFAAPQAFHHIDMKLDALLAKSLSTEELAALMLRLQNPASPPRAPRAGRRTDP